MKQHHSLGVRLLVVMLAIGLLAGCGIRRKKYETPIASDSQQPDKTLLDKAINDLEKSRYEVARLTLQTLINTYPDSEFLAKAKLAIADAWYRQGGTTALAQAEFEYKDFITFFPTMPEASEAQLKVAMIHYSQMEKANRDATHAKRAEDEFKQLLLQFSNSPFAEEAKQRLREVQEVLAQHEYDVARQYFLKGNPRATISRLKDLTGSYPNYSASDEALWMMGQSYEMGGKDYRELSASAYKKIVSDYPLSPLVEDAKKKLTDWKMEIPEARPEAYARMKYDLEHTEERGLWSRTMDIFRKRPDVSRASKSGEPVLLPRTETPEAAAVPSAEPGQVGIRLEPVPTGTEQTQQSGTAPTAPSTTPRQATPTGAPQTSAPPSTPQQAPATTPAAVTSSAPGPSGTAPTVEVAIPNRAVDQARPAEKKKKDDKKEEKK